MRGAGESRDSRQRFLSLPAPVFLLVAMLFVAGGLILFLTWEMTFYQDTWAFLMNRRDPSVDSLFAPHSEHIVIFPVLIEQLFIHVFGTTSARPEYVLSAVALLGTAVLLFMYLRRQVGDWLALFAASLVLFLGPAWEVLLWPFEVGFVGSVFFGLAALLSIERGDLRGDLAGCAFLALSAGFSSLGIPFLAAGAVAVVLAPRGRRLRRAYVAAIPILLFGAWYAGWGHEAESHVSLDNLINSPKFVAEAIAANAGSLLGLNPDPTTGALGRGPNPEAGLNPIWSCLVVAGIALALVIRQVRGACLSVRFWPAAALAFTNWFLTALNYFPGREATNSRYQYAGAVFTLMLVASLFDGFRPRGRIIAVAAVVSTVAVIPHLVVLVNGAHFLEEQSVLTRADTGALEIARGTVDPAFQLTDEVAGTPTLPNIYAGQYFAAVDEHGSPAYTPAELRTAPDEGRFQADIVLTYALPLNLSGASGGFGAGSACKPVSAGREVTLRPGTSTRIEVAPGPPVTILLRRFADAEGEYPVESEGQMGGSASQLTIPDDGVSIPWRFGVRAEQLVRVCSG
jgi:hypothetical protein